MQQKRLLLSSIAAKLNVADIVEAIVGAIAEVEVNLMVDLKVATVADSVVVVVEKERRSLPTSIQTSSALATMSKVMTSITVGQKCRRKEDIMVVTHLDSQTRM